MPSRRSFIGTVGAAAMASTVIGVPAVGESSTSTTYRVADVEWGNGSKTATVLSDGEEYWLAIDGWFSEEVIDCGEQPPLYPTWDASGERVAYTIDGNVYEFTLPSDNQQLTSNGEDALVLYEDGDVRHDFDEDTPLSVVGQHPLVSESLSNPAQEPIVLVDISVGSVEVVVEVQIDPQVLITVTVTLDGEVIYDLEIGPFDIGGNSNLVATSDETQTVASASDVPGSTPTKKAENFLGQAIADDIEERFRTAGTYFGTLAWASPAVPVPLPGEGPGIVDGETYVIRNVNSGKALDVAGAATDDGSNVHQWEYVSAANQHWTVESVGDGYYRLLATHSGKALDVAGLSQDDGGNVHQWEYAGNANQQWTIESTSMGYRIAARHSGKVLEVAGYSTDDGGNVQQWEDHANANQRWAFERV